MEEQTSFSTKAQILAELWITYRDDENFSDFIQYNDIGLPLAYVVSNGIVETTEMATRFIEETYNLLLSALDVDDDLVIDSLDHLLDISGE
jgi:hypothetical protein